MLEKLEGFYRSYLEIEEQMGDPDVVADMKRFVKLNKDYKDLKPIVEAYLQYKNVIENIESSKEILENEKDDEFRAMAKEELNELSKEKEKLDEDIKFLLIPKDPEDAKNVTVEIRAGTGW